MKNALSEKEGLKDLLAKKSHRESKNIKQESFINTFCPTILGIKGSLSLEGIHTLSSTLFSKRKLQTLFKMKTIVLFAIMAVAVATPASKTTPISKTNVRTEEVIEQVKNEPETQVKEEVPVVQEKDVQVKEEVVPLVQTNLRNLDDFIVLLPISQLRNFINIEGGLERHTPHVPAIPAIPAIPALPIGGSTSSHSYGYGAGAVRSEGETTSDVPATTFQNPFQFPSTSLIPNPFAAIFPSLSLSTSSKA